MSLLQATERQGQIDLIIYNENYTSFGIVNTYVSFCTINSKHSTSTNVDCEHLQLGS